MNLHSFYLPSSPGWSQSGHLLYPPSAGSVDELEGGGQSCMRSHSPLKLGEEMFLTTPCGGRVGPEQDNLV